MKDEGCRLKDGGTFSHDQVSSFPRGCPSWLALFFINKKEDKTA